MAVFSTGEAGYITHTSTQSIIKLIDKGMLKAWRVPGSRFRRIEERDLRDFMVRNAIPMDRFPASTSTVVLISSDAGLCSVAQKLSAEGDSIRCLSLFDAGFSWEAERPRAVIIDWNIGERAARAILARASCRPQPVPALIISSIEGLTVDGACAVVPRDFIEMQLPGVLERLCAGRD